MATRTDIYATAQRLLDRHGPRAGAFAGAMLRRRLEADDLTGAGRWLALGAAIEDLERLPPPGRRH